MASLALLAALGTAEAQTPEDFFDPSVLHEIRIAINQQDWLTLQQRYQENIYFPCEFQWRGLVAYDAGVRSRGFGSRNPVKPGLKVDFNHYSANQTFLGLKTVHLKNSAQDASMLKERLSMDFFRRMGLPAPWVAHARVYINGRYAGLYVVDEAIDKPFLKRTLGEDDGFLYEYEWDGPYNFEYRGADPALYTPSPFNPHTHEKDPQPGPLVDFIRIMNQATDSDYPGAMAALTDLRLYVAHAAIESYLGEVDGIVGDSGLANFYLYRFERRNWWQFFPWDKDNTFREADRPIFRNADTNLLMRRTVALPEMRAAYLEGLAKSAALAGTAGGWLEQEIRHHYEQIRAATYEDPVKQCSVELFGLIGPCSNEDFERAAAHLLEYVSARFTYIGKELSALGYAAGAGAPRLSEGGAADALSGAPVLRPGGLASLYGVFPGVAAEEASASRPAVTLGGVTVYINGFAAPLRFVSESQINVEVPPAVAPGKVPLAVLINGVVGNTVTVTVAAGDSK